MTFDKKAYDIQYHREKVKRVPLDMPKEKYDKIKAAADNVNESVNGYIKRAVDMRMESDGVATSQQNESDN